MPEYQIHTCITYNKTNRTKEFYKTKYYIYYTVDTPKNHPNQLPFLWYSSLAIWYFKKFKTHWSIEDQARAIYCPRGRPINTSCWALLRLNINIWKPTYKSWNVRVAFDGWWGTWGSIDCPAPCCEVSPWRPRPCCGGPRRRRRFAVTVRSSATETKDSSRFWHSKNPQDAGGL